MKVIPLPDEVLRERLETIRAERGKSRRFHGPFKIMGNKNNCWHNGRKSRVVVPSLAG